jgi:non-ribosomal peptide synthetase component F
MAPVRAEELLSPPNDASVANLVARSVRAFPDRLALEGGGETRTYAELDERVRPIAAGLAERDRRGVQKSVRYAMPPNPTTMRSAPGTW